MARTLIIVQAEIAALRASIATGALRARVDFPNGTSRDMTYRSLKEMTDTLAILLKEEAGLLDMPRPRATYFQTFNGL